MTEGVNIARTIANELDSAKFDPLLVQSVARYAAGSLDLMLTRLDGLVSSWLSVMGVAPSSDMGAV